MNVFKLLPLRRLRGVGMLLAMLAALQLAGCVTYAPPRPFTTEAETLAAKGEPTRRWQKHPSCLRCTCRPFRFECPLNRSPRSC